MTLRNRLVKAGLIALCGGVVATGWAAPSGGGTLTIGMETDFTGFNQAKARIFNQTTANGAVAVMEGLFAYNREGRIEPRLGLALNEADDRMSATVPLREGVIFHDGTPFNADAVVSHYNWIMDPKTGLNTAVIGAIEKVEKVDDYTVRFVLKQPWTALQSALAIDHLVNFIGSPTAMKEDPEKFHRNPVGTGPFVFKEWRPGDRLAVTRNEAYWDSSLPHVEEVVFRVLPDQDSRYQSLRAGEIDISVVPTPAQVVSAREEDDIRIHEHESSGALSWNFNQAKPPFDDKRVRQAAVHSIDRGAIVKAFYQNTTTATSGLVSAKSQWSCEDLDWPGFDLEKAKSLVEEANPEPFTHLSTNTPGGRRLGAIIQHFLQQAGFDSQLELIEQSQSVGKGLAGDYQMAIWRYVDFDGDPDLVLSSYLLSTVTRHDRAMFAEPLAKARAESDPQVRKAMYCDIAQTFADEAIFMIPIQSTYFILARPEVENVAPLRNNLVQVRDIKLKQ